MRSQAVLARLKPAGRTSLIEVGATFRGTAFYKHLRRLGAANNVDDALRAVGITQPPILRTNWDTSGSLGGPIVRDRLWFFANVRGWANASVIDGIVSNRFLGDASHWDYAPNASIESRIAETRKIVAGRLTAQISPRNRVTFSHDYQRRCGGSSLQPGGEGCRQAGDNWVASGRTFGLDTVSPETFPGYHDFPYNTTQVTYSAPISSRTLVDAGFSRFAYAYARFGMAAPDALMDLIPVTEITGIYGRPQFSYRGVFDPLDFGFNETTPEHVVARGGGVRDRRAHIKVGYMGQFQDVHNGRVPNQPSCATLQLGAPDSSCNILAPRLCRPTCRTSLRRAGSARQLMTAGLFAQISGPSAPHASGGVRYDVHGVGRRPTAMARLDLAFNRQPISFDRT